MYREFKSHRFFHLILGVRNHMLDALESAYLGFFLFPFLFYCIFHKYGLLFGAIISLILLSIIATLIIWITIQTAV